MKKVRFTEEQMVAILREADRSPVTEVARKQKFSEQTIYLWRKRSENSRSPCPSIRLNPVSLEMNIPCSGCPHPAGARNAATLFNAMSAKRCTWFAAGEWLVSSELGARDYRLLLAASCPSSNSN